MRPDMSKVIVERPRLGGGGKYPRHRATDSGSAPDDSPRRESMSRPWGFGKTLNENLAPLKRYLRSQVGRPWNKVYSEICQHMNRDSAVQLHIWQHLMDYVWVDGARRWWPETRQRCPFIVDPRTKLLRVNPEYQHRQRFVRPPDPDRIVVDATREYRKIEGIWYELALAPVPKEGVVFDLVRRAGPRAGQTHYVCGKRQLKKKELRELGKANDGWDSGH